MIKSKLGNDVNETIKYYNQNAESFAEGTIDIKFSAVQDDFLSKLIPGSSILDFGCGSGRDTKYFLERGFRVTALDGSYELCRIAEKNTGIPIIQMGFNDFKEKDKYDAIWACSSILHLPKDELKNVLLQMEQALRKGGFIYTSFKYGEYSGVRNGRFFTDFTEKSFRTFMTGISNLLIERIWITEDARPNRSSERWLNIYLRTVRG